MTLVFKLLNTIVIATLLEAIMANKLLPEILEQYCPIILRFSNEGASLMTFGAKCQQQSYIG